MLKKLHIPFKYKTKLNGREIDFIIGRYAIEIDGHEQSSERNRMILDSGFIPIHYRNNALLNNRSEIERDIKMKYYGI